MGDMGRSAGKQNLRSRKFKKSQRRIRLELLQRHFMNMRFTARELFEVAEGEFKALPNVGQFLAEELVKGTVRQPEAGLFVLVSAAAEFEAMDASANGGRHYQDPGVRRVIDEEDSRNALKEFFLLLSSAERAFTIRELQASGQFFRQYTVSAIGDWLVKRNEIERLGNGSYRLTRSGRKAWAKYITKINAEPAGTAIGEPAAMPETVAITVAQPETRPAASPETVELPAVTSLPILTGPRKLVWTDRPENQDKILLAMARVAEKRQSYIQLGIPAPNLSGSAGWRCLFDFLSAPDRPSYKAVCIGYRKLEARGMLEYIDKNTLKRWLITEAGWKLIKSFREKAEPEPVETKATEVQTEPVTEKEVEAEPAAPEPPVSRDFDISLPPTSAVVSASIKSLQKHRDAALESLRAAQENLDAALLAEGAHCATSIVDSLKKIGFHRNMRLLSLLLALEIDKDRNAE
ncbi:MAG: hypothetical protein ACOZBH_02520 [Patescibacteria group bacterium]